MAYSKKRVETFQVQFTTENNFSFEDLVTCNEVVGNNLKINGKEVSLKLLENNSQIIIGILETSRTHNIPPKKNKTKRIIEKLGLNGDEGLAYANVFLYEKQRKLLMYEVNKFGCFVDHFTLYLYRCCNKSEVYKSFDIKIHPVLKANEYERMLKMYFHKSIEIELANPTKILEVYQHENDALWNLCKTGSSINSTKVKTKFEVSAKNKSDGLASTSLRSIVDNALELLRGPKGENVEKLIVEGYEANTNDNKIKFIDLIADRYLKSISLIEPRENIDLLEEQRRSKIKELYESCIPDFDVIFGK